MAYRDTLFLGSPVVFCGITGFKESMIMGHRGVTGILENYDIKDRIKMVLAIHIPQSKLPKNAVIGNEPQTLYYRYKYLTWAFLAAAFYQSFKIFTLWRNLGKGAEEDLSESRAQLKASSPLCKILFLYSTGRAFSPSAMLPRMS